MYTPIWKFIDVLLFDIFDHKNANFVAPLLGNRFVPHLLEGRHNVSPLV